jgi:hypothetical protein
VILDLYHNSEGWIRTSGFALFIALKPHFSGLWFDSRFKNAIGSRYPYHICKIAIFVFLSIYLGWSNTWFSGKISAISGSTLSKMLLL